MEPEIQERRNAVKPATTRFYARISEIEQVMDSLILQGITADHIFLAGHSKGAWASLMLMDQVNKKFNAAILFAPALANRKSVENYPWWRGEVRPRQIKQMLQAKNMEALIFAYEDDEYNRPEDLEFLVDHYPDSVRIIAYRCDYEYTHNTHLHDCRLGETKKLIAQYMQSQIRERNTSP
jgi:dienelactone hydrolase